MLGSVPIIRATMLAGLDDLLRAKRVNTSIEQLLDEIGSKFKPPHHLELDTYLQLLERVGVLTRDPCFGLTFAKSYPVGGMKVLGFLAINAPDLRTMVGTVSRYIRLQSNGIDFKFNESRGVGSLTWQLSDQLTSPSKVMLEFAMALCVDRLKLRSDSDWLPSYASFTYPDPRKDDGCRRSYSEFFGSELEFNAPVCSIRAPSKEFERPIKAANSQLYELLMEYADQEMSELESAMTSEQRVTSALIDCLPMQEGNLEAVAKALKRTPRQLQDELKREGTHFEAILTAVRKRLAKSYLRTSTRSMTEISMVVGFSELSAFTRAVKSWYGLTPTELRDALKAGKKFD